ncbi:MAG: hypothetical protein MRY59_12720 [Aquisalinus sp.]|nr:hypothetical protein [Aquisalinus sp.]
MVNAIPNYAQSATTTRTAAAEQEQTPTAENNNAHLAGQTFELEDFTIRGRKVSDAKVEFLDNGKARFTGTVEGRPAHAAEIDFTGDFTIRAGSIELTNLDGLAPSFRRGDTARNTVEGGQLTITTGADGTPAGGRLTGNVKIDEAPNYNIDANFEPAAPVVDPAAQLTQEEFAIASQALQGPIKEIFNGADFDSLTTGEVPGFGTYTLQKNPGGQGGTIELQSADGGTLTFDLDASGQLVRGSADNFDVNDLIPTPELDETKLLDQDGLRIASQALQGPVKQAFDSAAFDSTTTGELDGIGTYTLRKNPAGQGGVIEVQLEDGGSVSLKLDASGQITRGSTDGVDINSLIPTPEVDNSNLLDEEGRRFARVAFGDAVRQVFDGAAFGSKTTGTIPGVGTYNLQKNPEGEGGIIEIQLEDGGTVTFALNNSGRIIRGSTENFDINSLVPNRDLFDSIQNFLGGNNFAGTEYNAEQTEEIIDLVNNANFDPETKQAILFALNFYLQGRTFFADGLDVISPH